MFGAFLSHKLIIGVNLHLIYVTFPDLTNGLCLVNVNLIVALGETS